MFYLKSDEKGNVPFLFRAGQDLVKSSMSKQTAYDIIAQGKITPSTNSMYPIGVNDKWFFAGEDIKHDSSASPKKRCRRS